MALTIPRLQFEYQVPFLGKRAFRSWFRPTSHLLRSTSAHVGQAGRSPPQFFGPKPYLPLSLRRRGYIEVHRWPDLAKPQRRLAGGQRRWSDQAAANVTRWPDTVRAGVYRHGGERLLNTRAS